MKAEGIQQIPNGKEIFIQKIQELDNTLKQEVDRLKRIPENDVTSYDKDNFEKIYMSRELFHKRFIRELELNWDDNHKVTHELNLGVEPDDSTMGKALRVGARFLPSPGDTSKVLDDKRIIKNREFNDAHPERAFHTDPNKNYFANKILPTDPDPE